MKFSVILMFIGLSTPVLAKDNQCFKYLSSPDQLPTSLLKNSAAQILTPLTTTPENGTVALDRNTIELPGRGHQFTSSEFDRLSENNKLVVSLLKAGLGVLDRSEVVLALKAINQPLIYFTTNPGDVVVPESLIQISKNQVNASFVKDNYIFFKSYLNQDFTEDELIGLSLLFADVKRPKRPVPAIGIIPKNKIEKEHYVNYLTSLLSRPHIAAALLRFLSNDWVAFEAEQAMRAEIYHYANAASEALKLSGATNKNLDIEASYSASVKVAAKVFNFDPDKLTEEYAKKRKFSEFSMNVIMSVIDRYSDRLFEYYESELKKNPILFQKFIINGKPVPMHELTRPERLIIIEKFLTDIANFKSVLGNLVDLIEHLIFGSAMPLKTDELELMIRSSVKQWLIPVRSQVSSFKIEANVKAQADLRKSAQEKSVDTVILSPTWGHSPIEVPKLNPNKRKNQLVSNYSDGSKKIVTQNQQGIEIIEADLDLASFSTFSDNQRSVEDLRSNVTYKFRFMRDGDDSRVYSIDFSDSVIKEFNHSPEVANLLLRALNLGFARTKQEDGLKILKTNKNGQAGRLYELKSRKSEVRLILQHNDGYWKVLKFTDKTNFDRVLNDLI